MNLTPLPFDEAPRFHWWCNDSRNYFQILDENGLIIHSWFVDDPDSGPTEPTTSENQEPPQE